MELADHLGSYPVTNCPVCDGYTALVIDPPTYVCMGCGQTGTAGASSNTPDARPNDEAREIAKTLHDRNRTVQEFTRHAVRYAKRLREARA